VDELLSEYHPSIDEHRIKRFMSRGFVLSQAMERWQTRGNGWIA
jgi:hypothetical protein